jgi:hypothetical protein
MRVSVPGFSRAITVLTFSPRAVGTRRVLEIAVFIVLLLFWFRVLFTSVSYGWVVLGLAQ